MRWLSLGGSAVDKGAAYRELVARRKACRQCAGLMNPSACCGGRFDLDQIGPWTLWQGALDARVLIVGQDWGDTRYFTKWAGRDQPQGNPTNENLKRLLASIGIQIGRPRDPQGQVVFMTNMILCLKTAGGLQGDVEYEWACNCAGRFFRPLMDIIRPEVIIALGKQPAWAILNAYDIRVPRSRSLKAVVSLGPYRLPCGSWLLPMYHCGKRGVNCNRSLELQLHDWMACRAWAHSQRLSMLPNSTPTPPP
jgi:DNA polymerase